MKKCCSFLSRPLTTETASELDVLGLCDTISNFSEDVLQDGHTDGDTLGVDSAKVGVFKQRHKIGFDRLLKGADGRTLEAQVGLEILGDFTDQALEGELADQELGRLLVPTNLTKSDGTGLVAVRLLDTAGRRRGLASCLGGELLTRSLATSGLAYDVRQSRSHRVMCQSAKRLKSCDHEVKITGRKTEAQKVVKVMAYVQSAWCEP